MSEKKILSAPASGLTRRQAIAGAALAFGWTNLCTAEARAGTGEEISRSAESIHQEPTFKASRKRLYDALTDHKQFDEVTKLSAAVRSGMRLGTAPTVISREEGGAFTLFGGHILGRHIELVPDERIVQAWRVVDWPPGVYSIVKFELTEHDSGTRIVFDHTGFPAGGAEHLAAGWKANYWEPLEKFLDVAGAK